MKKVGNLIRCIRVSYHLNREAFSEGICSAKYIYLIEKGERTPSVDILKALSYRVGMDIYDYLPYINYDEPIAVKAALDRMDCCMAERDYEGLDRLLTQIRCMTDYKKTELFQICKYADAWQLMHRDRLYEDAREIISELIDEAGGTLDVDAWSEMPQSYELMRFYNLMAVYYLITGDEDQGFYLISAIHQELSQVKNLKIVQKTYISVSLNYANALLIKQKFTDCESVCRTLLDYQMSKNELDRLHITYFIQGHLAIQQNDQSNAISYLQKSMCLAVALNKQQDYNSLFKYDFMTKLSKHFEVDLFELLNSNSI